MIIGGSRGLTGAPTMAALAAARAGAGYVTVAAAASAELSFTTRLLEVMFKGLPDADGALTPEAIDAAVAAVARADAVVLGPGLGRSPGAQALARELVQRIDVPLVIDADGLNAMAGQVEELRRRRWPTILTPHAGELARLLEVDAEEIGRARLHHARAAAERAKALIVLKGDDTLVAAPSGRVAISPGGAPALATAGTGDVLSGRDRRDARQGHVARPRGLRGGLRARPRRADRRGAARARRRDRLGRDRGAAARPSPRRIRGRCP